ncbi:hypothetical protein BT93_C2541 [Corymbia citriodora subsp. variegata]|nr:hypothetical protein BT93_C2541 [Corymbia citriodora subsp. variegata]
MLKRLTFFLAFQWHKKLKGPVICSEYGWFTKGIYPVFLMQFLLFSLFYVVLRVLLRPLRQPQFVSSVLVELLPVRTTGSLSLAYLLFFLAVKTDVTVIQRSMRNASIVGSSTVLMTFTVLLLMIHILSLPGIHKGFFKYIFAGIVSLTRFPNVVYAFNELNIMTSDLGQLAMCSSIFSELLLWLWLFISIYLRHGQQFFWSVLAALGVILGIFFIIQPLIMLIIQRTPESKPVREIYITSIFIGSLLLGVLTDMFGSMHFGVLLFGLVIPNGPPLGSTPSEKIEAVCREVLMPMFYVSIGYDMDLTSVDFQISREVILLAFVSALTRIVGALSAALFCKVRFQHYCFYNPHTRTIASIRRWRRSMQTAPKNAEMRVLCCVHDEDNVAGMISLLEASNPTEDSPTLAYVIHLNELVGHAIPIMAPYKKQMTRVGSKRSSHHIMRAFENYSNNSNRLVRVKPYTVIAAYENLHEYVCRLAQEEDIPLIIIPFHGSQDTYDVTELIAFRGLIQNMRIYALCTMATWVDKHMHHCVGKASLISSAVGMIFIGGENDREALALAIRMVGWPNVGVAVLRPNVDVDLDEKVDEKLDDELIGEYRAKIHITEGCTYHEVAVEDSDRAMSNIRALKGKFDLIMVGQTRRVQNLFSEKTMLNWSENPELGVIGDFLASSNFAGEMTSVLVMKHHSDTSRSRRNPSNELDREYLLRRTVC